MKKQVKSFGEFTRLNEGWSDNPEGFTSGSKGSRFRDSERDQYLFKHRSGESGNKPYLGKPARTQTIDKSRGGILLNYYDDHGRYEILLPTTGYNYIIGKDLEEAHEFFDYLKKLETFLGRGKREYGIRPETIAARAQVDMEKYLDSYSPDKFIALVQSWMDISPEHFETPSYYNESRKVNEDFFFPEPYGEESDILKGDQVYVAGMEDTPGTVVDFDEDEYGNPLVIVRIAGTEEGYRESDVYKLGDDYEEEY